MPIWSPLAAGLESLEGSEEAVTASAAQPEGSGAAHVSICNEDPLGTQLGLGVVAPPALLSSFPGPSATPPLSCSSHLGVLFVITRSVPDQADITVVKM